ncbi:tautomerase family protein [Orrella sp. 11846]|uniref:tautomerase family protein n=1 Tax=Orrella sp. 11846 TaxID=3409913 RepID=UPI003B59ACAC
MPIMHTRIPTGSSQEQKTTLLQSLSQDVVETIGAPLANVRVTLEEVAPADTIVGGTLGHSMAFVELILIEGRTAEAKAAVIKALAQTIEKVIGVSQQDTRIMVVDAPKTDLGVAGGITAAAAGR